MKKIIYSGIPQIRRVLLNAVHTGITQIADIARRIGTLVNP